MEVTPEYISQQLREIIIDKLGVNSFKVTNKASFIDDLGADSLDVVEFVMEVEKKFDVLIPDNAVGRFATVGDGVDYIYRHLPKKEDKTPKNTHIAIRIDENGKIQICLKQNDGSSFFSDGTHLLTSGIFCTTYNKWYSIIKELEEMINSPELAENDLQKFFERNPELLLESEYDMMIPQAAIIGNNNTEWRADFVLRPYDQSNFCKIVELKLPGASTYRKEKSGHALFYSHLYGAIRQLKDYYRAFHNENTKELFQRKYDAVVFEPDLQLIIGRKVDFEANKAIQELQKDNNMKITNWDSLVDYFKRKYT